MFFLKLWPWVETNKNRLITGAAVAVVVIFVIWFFISQRDQREIAAGQALAQLAVTAGGQTADAYLKVAANHPGTLAGQRASLQGAAALFDAGKYADAQTQFQKFLDAHPDNQFSGQALLGVAASLEAQNKTDLAASTYQRVSGGSDALVASAAKLALGRIYESQGRLNDALNYYEDVARSNPGVSLGAEAGLLAMELRSKMPAPATTAAPAAAAPVKLPAK